jgi:hypothetical protein
MRNNDAGTMHTRRCLALILCFFFHWSKNSDPRPKYPEAALKSPFMRQFQLRELWPKIEDSPLPTAASLTH